MKKSKVTVTRSAAELAKALGLTPADGAEIALRSDLNSKIVEVVRRKGATHAQVARLARTSRTRVTAIMNRNTKDISTDLLLRVLYSLGYTAKIKSKNRLIRVLPDFSTPRSSLTLIVGTIELSLRLGISPSSPILHFSKPLNPNPNAQFPRPLVSAG